MSTGQRAHETETALPHDVRGCRELLRDLAYVHGEMYRLDREVRVLGIEIPWLARE